MNDGILIHFVWYFWGILGLLSLLLLYCVIRAQARRLRLRIPLLTLHTCISCGLVFAVDRFHKKSHKVTCPGCGKEQFPAAEKLQARDGQPDW